MEGKNRHKCVGGLIVSAVILCTQKYQAHSRRVVTNIAPSFQGPFAFCYFFYYKFTRLVFVGHLFHMQAWTGCALATVRC